MKKRFWIGLLVLVLLAVSLIIGFTVKDEKGFRPGPRQMPENCTLWFDGCNACKVDNGEITECTESQCEEYKESECKKFSE